MEIRVADSDDMLDLLHFLRANGCIAYVTGGAQVIEALRPDMPRATDAEAAQIGRLVERWLVENPAAKLLPQ